MYVPHILQNNEENKEYIVFALVVNSDYLQSEKTY